MFTGIITDVGRVLESDNLEGDNNADRRIVIACSRAAADIAVGASVACSGICFTVVDKGEKKESRKDRCWFAVDASGETLGVTTAGDWEAGHAVNLERALRAGDELGGHFVSGHVDGIATVTAVEKEAGSHRVRINAPRELMGFIAPKGSVALDGISLTVNHVGGDEFDVNCIPHTWSVTTWRDLQVGCRVNLEIDTLARYTARWAAYSKTGETHG
ncbi:MAG: riboflavin synthase [Parvularculales bacterium]